MKPQKPSKKINIAVVVFVLLAGIIIGGYLVLQSRFSVASLNQKLIEILESGKETVSGCQPDANDKDKDSDNDGLMDWQEIIWQTDPCKPDSDGDGYVDGEEVTAGYDPTKKAPNDLLPDKDPTSPRSLPQNLTQALAQSLTNKITDGEVGIITDALDPSSINLSNQAVDSAIKETINKAIQEFSLPYISDEEILISSDNSKLAIQNYAGEIVKVIDYWANKTSINRESSFDSEAELFYYTLQTKDFNEIDKYILFYKNVSENIKKVSTPSDLKEIHKEQIGIFQVVGNIHQAIKEVDIDPLRTGLALEQYKGAIELFNQTLSKLTNYINTHP